MNTLHSKWMCNLFVDKKYAIVWMKSVTRYLVAYCVEPIFWLWQCNVVSVCFSFFCVHIYKRQSGIYHFWPIAIYTNCQDNTTRMNYWFCTIPKPYNKTFCLEIEFAEEKKTRELINKVHFENVYSFINNKMVHCKLHRNESVNYFCQHFVCISEWCLIYKSMKFISTFKLNDVLISQIISTNCWEKLVSIVLFFECVCVLLFLFFRDTTNKNKKNNRKYTIYMQREEKFESYENRCEQTNKINIQILSKMQTVYNDSKAVGLTCSPILIFTYTICWERNHAHSSALMPDILKQQ